MRKQSVVVELPNTIYSSWNRETLIDVKCNLLILEIDISSIILYDNRFRSEY